MSEDSAQPQSSLSPGSPLSQGADSPAPPSPEPEVKISTGRQILLLGLALCVTAPLPTIAGIPSIYSPHIDPSITFLAALLLAAITFITLPLWSRPIAAIHLFAATLWCCLAGQMGPVSAMLVGGIATGAVLHICARNRLREEHSLIAIPTAMAVAVLGMHFLGAWVRGTDPLATLTAIPEHLVDTSLNLWRETLFPYGPLPLADQELLDIMWVEMRPTWIWLMPANGLVIYSLILWLASRAIRRRFPDQPRTVTPFWAFGVSDIYVIPVIALCLLDVVAIKMGISPLRLLADNALWIMLHLYWVAGLAVGHCLMLQIRMALPMRLIGWLAMLMFLKYPVAAVGLLDTWFQFRRHSARLMRGPDQADR